MRVTPKELPNVIKTTEKEKLMAVLRFIFSFPYNIDTFSKYCFSHAILNDVPDFHKEMYKELFKKKNSVIVAPRGHAKSTCAGLVFPIFSIVNKLEKYIVYVSQSHAKTVQFLTPIRNEFKTNTALKLLYGDLTPSSAKNEDGKDREDCFDVNGIRIEAVSFEKNLRGFKYVHDRPSLIILDDIEEDQRVMNPELRRKDEFKLNKIIIPSLDIEGRIKFIGTLLHYDSLLNRKRKQYDGLFYKACTADFKEVLWPERFSEQKLRAIKKDIGSLAFRQEFLNDPTDSETSLIKPEWIKACFREDLSAEDLYVYQYDFKTLGVDFAFSDAVSADESAFVSIGSKDGYYYLFDCRKKKGMSATEQLLEIQHILHKKFKYDKIGLEENSIKAVSKDLKQYKLPLRLYWTAAKDPATQRVSKSEHEYQRNTVGKFAMIQRIATYFENKQIIIPYKTEKDKQTADLIMAECTSYALMEGKLVEAGVHPDIPIALGYALESQIKEDYTFLFA